jgi:hypothetical protein
MVPLLADTNAAQLSVVQQSVDAVHGANPVFQQTLNDTWGPDRAALAVQQGQAPLADYVTVVLDGPPSSSSSSTSQKRSASSSAGALWAATRQARIWKLASLLQAQHNATVYEGQNHALADNILNSVGPMAASLAPVGGILNSNMQVNMSNDTYVAMQANWDAAYNLSTTGQLNVHTLNALNTMLASGVGAVVRFARPSPVATDTTSPSPSYAPGQKRALAQAVTASPQNNALVSLSSGLGVLVRGVPTLVSDIVSGRAAAKAAGVANVSTKINWVASTNYSNYGRYMLATSWGKTIQVAARPPSVPGYQGVSSTPFFASVSERLTAAWQLRQEIATTTNPVATQLAQRLGLVASAVRDTWFRVHVQHQPLIPSPTPASIARSIRVSPANTPPLPPFPPTPGNGTHCLTNFTTLCTYCWALDQFTGYAILSVELPVGFFANTAQPDFNQAQALYSDYYNITAYLAQENGTAIVGNSSANPVRFPALNVSAWAYIDDNIPGKIGFTDLQPLINETITFIKSLFGNITLSLGIASEAVTVLASEASSVLGKGARAPSPLRLAYERDLAAWQADPVLRQTRPRPLRPEYTNLVLGVRALVTMRGLVSKFLPASVLASIDAWITAPVQTNVRAPSRLLPP